MAALTPGKVALLEPPLIAPITGDLANALAAATAAGAGTFTAAGSSTQRGYKMVGADAGGWRPYGSSW